ncbi:uncharacterized protein RHIMIDRAFT_35377 [Rhizopus microsporus ATCC 52813]|uniref:Uncharacterized protein n=1 Tax=Rhizopus microsporus ATCC 52813 TaxID=1340429 RepID=A0A2G4SN58_RHIZD|nr:uncharacterized protein RHIMIDRAFT_35377 [Rhizopus microsporus ATCC 52813]PHZ10175.1 hypothetical protein RHIMIDRAFT_35377 [Rhizopus microsporus ATCC 52813]
MVHTHVQHIYMIECEQINMTPAETIRNQYYLSQQGQSSSNQNVPDKTRLPRQEPQMTLYEPQSDQEPKIVLEHNNNNNNSSASEFQKSSDHIIRRNSSKFLLKLSKSTAPMRAKLSTLSPSKFGSTMGKLIKHINTPNKKISRKCTSPIVI